MENVIKNVALYGPHDRFNYGDFLFPLMFEYAAETKFRKKMVFSKYSIINSDYTSLGAFKSKSFWRLRKDVNQGKIDTIIITGGECLNARWTKLYSFISPFYSKLILNNFFQKIDGKTDITKIFLGGISEYPFSVSKRDFKKPVKTIYNSVGGLRTSDILPFVEKADYLALRDENSYNSWKELNIKCYLVPDSAIILSDVFDKNTISREYSKLIRRSVLRVASQKFIFFQISNSKFKNENALDEVAFQLDQIKQKTGFEIVLCPIGTAPGHEDDKALKSVAKKMKIKCVIIENPTLHEILFLLANSSLFVGTSLHGVITCMSYNIPYVAIGNGQSKLRNYLDCWSVENFKTLYSTKHFKEQALIILGGKVVNQSSEIQKQKRLYYNSVERILDII